jgi:hypothetical protein
MSCKAAMHSGNGRLSDRSNQRFSNTLTHAKVLTEFLTEDAEEGGRGFAVKP